MRLQEELTQREAVEKQLEKQVQCYKGQNILQMHKYISNKELLFLELLEKPNGAQYPESRNRCGGKAGNGSNRKIK